MTELENLDLDVEPDQGAVAFEDLYRRTYGGALALAIATVRDRSLAEDLVHDAYAQLWTRRFSVTHPTAWLRRAVLSNCLASLRTQRRRMVLARRQVPESIVEVPEDTAFLDLLAGLNERQRIAITLRYVHDLPETEIAAVMGCRPGTVKSTLHRAVRVLRDRMEGDDHDLDR